MRIPFMKMNGTGNDFIIVDGRSGIMDGISRADFVRKVCRRRESVGADGVIIIEDSPSADFKWDFFNSDGSAPEMCGNGSRCAARFAVLKKIAPNNLSFITKAGRIRAEVKGSVVKVGLTDATGLVKEGLLYSGGGRYKYGFINSGVPHVVLFRVAKGKVDVEGVGMRIRNHRRFAPDGTNVNFVHATGDELNIRTYERGVEGETLACGTGAVASAILAGHHGLSEPPVSVVTRSGERLLVDFVLTEKGARSVSLEGETALVYEGFIKGEAIK